MDKEKRNDVDGFLALMATTLDAVDRQLVTADDALADLRTSWSREAINAGLRTSEGNALFERLIAIVRSPPVSRSLDSGVEGVLQRFASTTRLATVAIGYPNVTFRYAATGYVGPFSAWYGISIYCHHSEVPFDRVTARLDDVEVQVGDRWVPWPTWCKEASAQRIVVICGRCRRDTLVQRARLCGRTAQNPLKP